MCYVLGKKSKRGDGEINVISLTNLISLSLIAFLISVQEKKDTTEILGIS